MATTRTAAQRKRARAMRTSTAVAARPRAADGPLPDDEELYEEDAGWVVPRRLWPAIVGLTICVLGIGISSYLAYVHFKGLAPICPTGGGIVDCAAVVTSQWSTILGIPVPVLGLAFFVGMIPFQLPVAWRSANPLVRRARLLGGAVGVGMILWLLYAELFLIGKICLWCTSVHLLTFVLFVVTVLGTIATTPEPE
jgi:uncharacterized membrane protein